eukprot:748632-Hanusia_phi.AAC.5
MSVALSSSLARAARFVYTPTGSPGWTYPDLGQPRRCKADWIASSAIMAGAVRHATHVFGGWRVRVAAGSPQTSAAKARPPWRAMMRGKVLLTTVRQHPSRYIGVSLPLSAPLTQGDAELPCGLVWPFRTGAPSSSNMQCNFQIYITSLFQHDVEISSGSV